MSVNQEVVSTNLLKLTYVADAEKVEAGLAYSFNKNKKNFVVKGFRAGKAPRKIVEQYYGVEVLFGDAEEYIITDMYYSSIEELGIIPVSHPQNVTVTKMDKESMEFSLEVYTKPEVELGEYKNLEITEVSDVLTDEEVDNAIKSEAEKNARMVTVEDRAAEMGDTVNIDFEGFVDGVAFEGGKGEGFKLKLGSGQFIPGFEDQLVGVASDSDVTVNVKFPEDYHAEELKGKDAEFKVKVHEIQKQELPEINDDFASDVSEFDTLEEYKADLSKNLAEKKAENAKAAMTEEALRKAIDNAKVEIPACMVDAEVENEIKKTEQQVSMYGMDFATYCQYMGTTVEEFKERIRPQAELHVKRDLVLEAILKVENFEVSDEEVDKEFAEAAEYFKKTVEEVKDMFADRRDAIVEDIKRRKAVELIFDSAVKVAAKEESAAEEKKPAKKAPAKKKTTAKKAETTEENA